MKITADQMRVIVMGATSNAGVVDYEKMAKLVNIMNDEEKQDPYSSCTSNNPQWTQFNSGGGQR